MEHVTGLSPDRDVTQNHLKAARAALQSLETLAAPVGATLAGSVVAGHVRAAMTELSGMDLLFALDLAPASFDDRVACAYCGKMIMSAATLCGFCWHRQSHPATARAAAPGEKTATRNAETPRKAGIQ